MHPAPSVIVFTCLSGLGFGLIFWLGLGAQNAAGLGAFLWCLLGGGLAVAGLLASTLHLGRPERAIKAFSQWRSSWLSREGIAAIATLLVFALYAAFWVFGGLRIAPLGWIAAALALVTVFTTAMIYAQLKTVPRWNTALTPVVFLLFSLSGPALLVGFPLIAAILFVLLFGAIQLHWRRGDKGLGQAGVSPESATGLGEMGKVRLLEAPHTSPNYLMKEMVYRVARSRASALRFVVALAGFVVPILLIVIFRREDGLPLIVTGLAVILHVVGTFAQRWLFFAEAEHVVGLYYGQR